MKSFKSCITEQAERAVEVAKSFFRQKDLVGTLAYRRGCLFFPPQKPHMDKARENERDHIIQEED